MTRLETLAHSFEKLRAHQKRIANTSKDAAGFLTPAGAAYARQCLRHANFTLTSLKSEILKELEI